MVMGMFMKIIMADTIFAPVVDQIYANTALAGRVETWAAIFSFSGQIFCDFSGYSICAIGAALCFGFVLPDNFRSPYGAMGFRDFWKRWHISLSTWLRDYLYISLGGNRLTPMRTIVNLLLTMLIGGLWHGASWLFVIWGGLHGFYLVLEKTFKQYWQGVNPLSMVTRTSLILFTYLITSLTWVFFRSRSFSDVEGMFSGLVTNRKALVLTDTELHMALAASLLLAGWHIFMRNRTIEGLFAVMPGWLRVSALFSMLLSIYLFAGGDDRAFIYFQF
jgi:D-alanyl-lipoteichoic acid acyltransferase DltB (MBOAT superfamily)